MWLSGDLPTFATSHREQGVGWERGVDDLGSDNQGEVRRLVVGILLALVALAAMLAFGPALLGGAW